MLKKRSFKFIATVSDRGQIFVPKVLQEYLDVHSRDKVIFIVEDDGSITFKKKEGDKL